MARPAPDDDERTALEKHVARSFIDPGTGYGKPLSRRTRQTKRTVESYLKAGVLPRYMERLREIETGLRSERRRIERAYRELQDECAGDPDEFARRWRVRVGSWRFDELNALIREHNDWYPIEANLPMDPRTRDYVPIRGRSYRREELDPRRILERFPARFRGEAAA